MSERRIAAVGEPSMMMERRILSRASDEASRLATAGCPIPLLPPTASRSEGFGKLLGFVAPFDITDGHGVLVACACEPGARDSVAVATTACGASAGLQTAVDALAAAGHGAGVTQLWRMLVLSVDGT